MKIRFSRIILTIPVFLFVFAFSACKNNTDTEGASLLESIQPVVSEEATAAPDSPLPAEQVREALGDACASWDGNYSNLTDELKKSVEDYFAAKGTSVEFRDNGVYLSGAEITTVLSVETAADSTATEASATDLLTETKVRTTNPPAANPGTTKKQPEYFEWTYKNKSGKNTTYTENPNNKYIAEAAKQLKIDPNQFSAIYYNNQAAILYFNSVEKSKETLKIFYMFNIDKMKVQEAVWEVEGLSKEMKDYLYGEMQKQAIRMYEDAFKHKPK